ncbi:MAG: chemotaxis protein MotB, partial [SAR324 cluster bacterium]|nr:chemotaxis protein MotB [SAR324 cluster bacterium]
MPIQEEEHKCEEFDQDWIFTYGDMVTLLLVFFVLLLTFCKTDIEKFKSVAESFKPTPPGSPYFLEGQPSVL